MKDRSILLGSLAAGLLASACCIGPLVLGVLGLGTLGLGAALEPYRPWFLGATGVFLAVGFYLAYRPRRPASCEPGEACATRPASRRKQRILLWIVTALTIGVATYPNWSAALSRPPSATATAARRSIVTLDVTGMTCSACAVTIEKELMAVPGVSDARADFESGKAVIGLSEPRPDTHALVAAVERAGYRAAPSEARGSTEDSPKGARRDSMTVLDASLGPLIADFNAQRSADRFLAILSPRCPACAHGAGAIKKVLLDGPGSASIFIVWTPMVAGDDVASAREAMASLRSARVRHYYDPGNHVGTAFRRDVFPNAIRSRSAASRAFGHTWSGRQRKAPRSRS